MSQQRSPARPPTPARGRPARQARAELRDSAVEVALELAEREGAAALTMRRLGEQLGVDPTTLYRLFGDKDELLLAVFDRMLSIMLDELGEVPAELDWREVLRRVAEHTWQVSLRYPAIMSQTFARTTGGPAERRTVELLLTTIARTGLDAEQTVLAYRAWVDALLSMCGQAAALRALDPQLRDKDATAWSRIYARLAEQDYPAARRHAEYLTAVGEREIFDAVMAGLLAMIERRVEATV